MGGHAWLLRYVEGMDEWNVMGYYGGRILGMNEEIDKSGHTRSHSEVQMIDVYADRATVAAKRSL